MRKLIGAVAVCALFVVLTGAGLVTQSGPRHFTSSSSSSSSSSGGSFAHGDAVTITGSGFPSSMPTFYFAGGANGVLETTTTGQTPDQGFNSHDPSTTTGSWNWLRFEAPDPPGVPATIINDGTRGKVIGRSSSFGECSQEVRFSSGVGFSTHLMVKYYARYDTTGGSDPAQYKLGTFQAGLSEVDDTNGSNFKFTWLGGSGMAYNVPSGGTSEETWYLPDEPHVNNTWQRIEHKIITPSAQGTANGEVYYRITQNSVESYMVGTGANDGTPLNAVSLYPNSLRYTAYLWQNWGGNSLTANGFGIDDHYVSVGSFAAVELWNNCTPSLATVREIQEPTSWSSTSITVRLNKGGLAAGDYCLVVLDDSVADTVLATRTITVLQLIEPRMQKFDGWEAANDDAQLQRAA